MHLQLQPHLPYMQDRLQPYLDATKALYKALVSVRKTPAGAAAVASSVWEITDVLRGSGVQCELCRPPLQCSMMRSLGVAEAQVRYLPIVPKSKNSF
jgi:Domain of unknown function (DUF4498)